MHLIMHCFAGVGGLFWAVLLYSGSVFSDEVADCPRTGLIALPNFHVIDVRLAVTKQAKIQGLSGLREADFGPRDAMLFWSAVDHPWGLVMRDMYFDLDMFFLDEQLRVVDVRRGLKAHPGRSTTPPMDYVKSVPARYAMEMRTDSPAARAIEKGTQLHWSSKPALAELGACGQTQ